MSVCTDHQLDRVDPRCGALDYIVGSGRTLRTEYAMSKISPSRHQPSLILRRWTG